MSVTTWLRNSMLLASMVAASGLAWALKPTVKVADSGPKVNLETLIPKTFGDWREVPFGGGQIVDPEQKVLIDKIYNQTLTRAYVNARGYLVMLSIAYGSDQSDSLQLHKPEVCYPAQGFQLLEKRAGSLTLPSGNIPATRLLTTLGTRSEPVTYWILIGDRVVTGSVQKKLVEMSYGLKGKIPDGMLVRMSSIDREQARAYDMQQLFAEQMLSALGPAERLRLVGASIPDRKS